MANGNRGISGFIGGAADFITHPLQRGFAKTQGVKLQNKRIKAFIESQKIQDALNKVRTEAIQGGRTITGSTPRGAIGRTPSDQIGKLSETIARLNNLDSDEAKEAVAFLSGKMTDLIARDKAATDTQDPIDKSLKAVGGRAALPRVKPKDDLAKPPPKDRRSLFSGTDPTFDSVGPPRFISPTPPVADANDPANVSAALRPADLFQAPTPDFPESNVPPSFGDIGLTAKDDIAQFSELEKKLPDIDLRSQYQSDPESFGKILQWLKAGKTPNGKPFTLKDAIDAIVKNQ